MPITAKTEFRSVLAKKSKYEFYMLNRTKLGPRPILAWAE